MSNRDIARIAITCLSFFVGKIILGMIGYGNTDLFYYVIQILLAWTVLEIYMLIEKSRKS